MDSGLLDDDLLDNLIDDSPLMHTERIESLNKLLLSDSEQLDQ